MRFIFCVLWTLENTEEAIEIDSLENWQHRVHKTTTKQKTQNNMCWTENVNRTWGLLQTNGGLDEPNIVLLD